MDPLPSVSRACLMIERVEQQKQVNVGTSHTREVVAAAVNKGSFVTSGGVSDHNTLGSLAFLAKGSNMSRF